MRLLPAVLLLSALACSSKHPKEHTPNLRVTADLQVGGAEEGAASFADIRGFAVDRHGDIYVLEAQAQEIRVFDSTGSFVRKIGRRGAGPGEFAMANGLALDADDHLWVYDPGNSRAVVFDTAGNVEHTYLLPLDGYGYVWVGGVDRQKRLYDEIRVPVGDTVLAKLRRTDPVSGKVDTLNWPRCGAPQPQAYKFPQGYMSVPFSGGEYLRFDGRGSLWCADTRTLKVQQYRLGDTTAVHSFTAEVDPAPVTESERDSSIWSVRVFMTHAGTANPDFSLIPKLKPVLLGVSSDDRGRVWAMVEVKSGFKAVIFDSAGHLVARAPLPYHPARWAPEIIRGDQLYALTHDSLDLPSVTRYRIK